MDLKINCHFIDGAFIEILGNASDTKKYNVKFINKKTNKIDYQTEIPINSWAKSSKKYFIDWRIELYCNDLKIYEHNLDKLCKRSVKSGMNRKRQWNFFTNLNVFCF